MIDMKLFDARMRRYGGKELSPGRFEFNSHVDAFAAMQGLINPQEFFRLIIDFDDVTDERLTAAHLRFNP